MRECIDAIHLTVEAGRRGSEHDVLFAEAMGIWDSAFRAADLMSAIAANDALRVVLESCRTLVGVLSTTFGGSP